MQNTFESDKWENNKDHMIIIIIVWTIKISVIRGVTKRKSRSMGGNCFQLKTIFAYKTTTEHPHDLGIYIICHLKAARKSF